MAHQASLLTFPGKEIDENIFVFVRRFPLAFVPSLALTVVVAVLGGVLILLLGYGDIIGNTVRVLLASAFFLLMLLFGLIEFIDFYFDIHIVTDRRIVDIDQLRLFNRDVQTLLLDDIQDVQSKTKGFFPTLFNYGDVVIQSAGAKPNFIFSQIRHPENVAAIIIDLSDQTRRGVVPTERRPEGEIAAILFDKEILRDQSA